MNLTRYVARSLRHRALAQLGVALGVAVVAATIVGALGVGDSVRATLRAAVDARLGAISETLEQPNGTFRAALADALGAAPLLVVDAVASTTDGERAWGNVRLVGVEERFWRLMPGAPPWSAAGGEAVDVSEPLARALALEPGETLVFRARPPDAPPGDIPLGSRESARVGVSLTVRRILTDSQGGGFSLASDHRAVWNAFVPIETLQAALGAKGRANLLVADHELDVGRLHGALSTQDLPITLERGLEGVELRSPHLFIDPRVRAAAAAIPGASRTLGYFANELRVGDRSTPYSIIVASDGTGLGADEVRVNRWLANDLGAREGDELNLSYDALAPDGSIVQRSARLRIRDIVDVDAIDRTLAPRIPGLSGAAHCRDWDPGVPIDLSRLRPQDEAYWDVHRDTPKAIVSYETGQRLWGNRFGDTTLLRWPPAVDVETELPKRLDPGEIGLRMTRVRSNALEAARGATDLGALFLGFGAFLIASALLLSGLLLTLELEVRARERMILSALGFDAQAIRRLFLLEGVAVVLAGSSLGALLGLGFTRVVMGALTSRWRAASGLASFVVDVRPGSIVAGGAATLFLALAAVHWVLRERTHASTSHTAPRWARWITLPSSLGAALVLLVAPRFTPSAQAGVFFVAGALALVAWIGATRLWIARLLRPRPARHWTSLAISQVARRPSRSVGTVALLAASAFIVFSVGAGEPPDFDPRLRTGPAGGFAWLVSTTLPAYAAVPNAVPFRVRDGDDASCLTPTQAARPRLLGVAPKRLEGRFRFQGDDDWSALSREIGPGIIPAIGDETTVRWMLHADRGTEFDDFDDAGHPLKLRIAGILEDSILQGALIISEQHFTEHFPASSGYRRQLVDGLPTVASADQPDAMARSLRELGPTIEPTKSVLDRLHAVERTYRTIFGSLGALGLLLGCLGLAVLTLRHHWERRHELAVMSALGFGRARIVAGLVIEHAVLLLLGLAGGLACAFLTLPTGLGAPASLAWLRPAIALGITGLATVTIVSALATNASPSRLREDDALDSR